MRLKINPCLVRKGPSWRELELVCVLVCKTWSAVVSKYVIQCEDQRLMFFTHRMVLLKASALVVRWQCHCVHCSSFIQSDYSEQLPVRLVMHTLFCSNKPEFFLHCHSLVGIQQHTSHMDTQITTKQCTQIHPHTLNHAAKNNSQTDTTGHTMRRVSKHLKHD